jgi:hypothetical protein
MALVTIPSSSEKIVYSRSDRDIEDNISPDIASALISTCPSYDALSVATCTIALLTLCERSVTTTDCKSLNLQLLAEIREQLENMQ